MNSSHSRLKVGLLTGGQDKSYALGLTAALTARDIDVEFVGSDGLDDPSLRSNQRVRFLNLRGDQSEEASALVKVRRLCVYYGRLVRYAAATRAPLLHILWNNKFEHLDRTLVMWIYRALGKRVVLTAHNVNAAKRDGVDTWFNRLTLRLQYALCHHVFVHSQNMKAELMRDFRVSGERISVIPFGLNATTPDTALTPSDARARLGLPAHERVLVCFGQIAPYKGVEYLLSALERLAETGLPVRLLIAGKVKRGHEDYWRDLERRASAPPLSELVSTYVRFVPDDEVEVFFKAADAVVLPYTSIFQSGVPFLAYAYGAPVIATDVGALREDVEEDVTGYICPPRDPMALAETIRRFFKSSLYRNREKRRAAIRELANTRHSWNRVGAITSETYCSVLGSRDALGVAESS